MPPVKSTKQKTDYVRRSRRKGGLRQDFTVEQLFPNLKDYTRGSLFLVKEGNECKVYFAPGVDAQEIDEMQLTDEKEYLRYVDANRSKWVKCEFRHSFSVIGLYKVERVFSAMMDLPRQ
jgi:hypothetical protein